MSIFNHQTPTRFANERGQEKEIVALFDSALNSIQVAMNILREARGYLKLCRELTTELNRTASGDNYNVLLHIIGQMSAGQLREVAERLELKARKQHDQGSRERAIDVAPI